jgi:hypothetical protein
MVYLRFAERSDNERDQGRTFPSPMRKHSSIALSGTESSCAESQRAHEKSPERRLDQDVSRDCMSPKTGYSGKALKEDMVQQSPLLTSPSKNLPRRRSSTMDGSSLQASVLSTRDKKKKKSSSRKKQGCGGGGGVGGGLGIFLSMYDGKEKRQERKGRLFSSSGSYNGSVGSESTSSMKSITSMPARMFCRSGRSDRKEAASVKGQQQGMDKSNGIEHTSHSSSSSITRRSAAGTTTPSSSPSKKYLSRCASFDGYEPKTAKHDESNSLSRSYHESPRQAMKKGTIRKDNIVLAEDTSSSRPNTPRRTASLSPSKSSLARATYHGDVPTTPRRDEESNNMTQSDHGPRGATTPRRVRPLLNRGGLIPSPTRRVNPNFGIDQYLGDRVTRSYEQLLFDFQDSSSSFEVDASLVLSDVPLLVQSEEKTKCVDMSGPVQGANKALSPGPPLARNISPEKLVNRNASEGAEEALPRNCPECTTDVSEEECLLPPELNRHTSEESLACPFQRPSPETRRVNRQLSTPDDLILGYFSILKEFDDSAGACHSVASVSLRLPPVSHFPL